MCHCYGNYFKLFLLLVFHCFLFNRETLLSGLYKGGVISLFSCFGCSRNWHLSSTNSMWCSSLNHVKTLHMILSSMHLFCSNKENICIQLLENKRQGLQLLSVSAVNATDFSYNTYDWNFYSHLQHDSVDNCTSPFWQICQLHRVHCGLQTSTILDVL